MKIRTWLFWLFTIAFIWLVVSRFTEVEKLAEILTQGRWEWVLAAALLEFGFYVTYAALYQSAFYTVEVSGRLWQLVPVMFSSVFVAVVAPSGGASAAALFVDDAARRGQPAARAAAGAVLVMVTDFSAFALILLVGLTYLFRQHDLTYYEIIGAAGLLAMTLGLASSLFLAMVRPDRLHALFGRLQRAANGLGRRFGRPVVLAEDWSERHAGGFIAAAGSIIAHPWRLGRTLAVALGIHLFNLASLYTLFLAFGQPIGLRPLVAGYAVGILFVLVSPIPMGIGMVEGVMPLVFISLGVPAAVATVVTLAFRGLGFWLPFLLGFILLHRVVG